MKVKFWKRMRRIESGVVLEPNGHWRGFTDDRGLTANFRWPVEWDGQPATMVFRNNPETFPVNSAATDLLRHPNFSVRGTVCIITNVERRYKMRAWASHDEVTYSIENLLLDTAPIIVDVTGKIDRQDIYAATEHDLFAIRMCL